MGHNHYSCLYLEYMELGSQCHLQPMATRWIFFFIVYTFTTLILRDKRPFSAQVLIVLEFQNVEYVIKNFYVKLDIVVLKPELDSKESSKNQILLRNYCNKGRDLSIELCSVLKTTRIRGDLYQGTEWGQWMENSQEETSRSEGILVKQI